MITAPQSALYILFWPRVLLLGSHANHQDSRQKPSRVWYPVKLDSRLPDTHLDLGHNSRVASVSVGPERTGLWMESRRWKTS